MQREAAGDEQGALLAFVRSREAVHNCRRQAAVGNPRARKAYEAILARVDVAALRRRISALRRRLYR